jgi:hypothetical protein
MADVIDAGRKLVQEHAGIGAILLECTNMVPYARTLRAGFLSTTSTVS